MSNFNLPTEFKSAVNEVGDFGEIDPGEDSIEIIEEQFYNARAFDVEDDSNAISAIGKRGRN